MLGLPLEIRSSDFAKVMHFLMAQPEMASPGMLEGKRVGLSSFGLLTISPRGALQAISLDPARDMSIITLGANTLRYTALHGKHGECTHMPLPFNIQVRKDG